MFNTGRQGTVLSTQVEAGQLGSQHNTGMQNSLPAESTSNSTGPLCLQTEEMHTVSTEERSHSGIRTPRKLACSWSQRAKDIDPQYEQVHEVQSLQDGGHSVCK